jgi:hypothetical protein
MWLLSLQKLSFNGLISTDDFTPVPRPPTKEEQEIAMAKNLTTELPPYNGYGSYEDSAINCRTVNPFTINKSYKQFYELDK